MWSSTRLFFPTPNLPYFLHQALLFIHRRPSIPLLPSSPPIVPSPVPSTVPTIATPITSPVPSTVPTVATPSDIHTVSTPTSPTPDNFSTVPEIRTRARPGAPLATHPMTTWSMTNSLPPRTFFTSKHPLPNPKPPSQRGFNQREGQDYFKTFSPVVKPVTIRTVLTLAVGRNWSIRQLDINNVFLNGNLDEEVYMVQPSGFQDKTHPDAVCRLNKSLYGLKQSPRAWYQRLTSYLLDLGFTLSKADSSLLVRYTSTATIFVLIYVDDIIITGSSPKDIACLLADLQREFSIKDLGALHYFLGIEVTNLQSGLHFAQTKYTTDILSLLGLSEVKPLSTPIVTGSKLSKYDDTPLPDSSIYRGTVGALQYLTLTRPDIQYAINQTCQFQQNSTDTHWSAVKRILRYLKGTLNYGLVIHPSSYIGVDVYSDADSGGCPDDRRQERLLAFSLVARSFHGPPRNNRRLHRSSVRPRIPRSCYCILPKLLRSSFVQRTQGVRLQPSGDLV
ncbi:hypothetical protein H6P81_013841 [Aristolochia fimbriata]|uniref:Reverse transcriptase Ty1/copia-type domain-containing protein n=1 Tax=Aristolochia fimbriata TaxID=158543 RepID=A0AAV7EFU2_ARIFI|nr:hypothetical protein H6P81_013841 [Aristolochia fimbriata]